MFQVVIDTNVLLSALNSTKGASYRLLSLIGDKRWQLNLSVALVLEYEDVLKRPEASVNLTHQEIDDVLDSFAPKQTCARFSTSGGQLYATRKMISF